METIYINSSNNNDDHSDDDDDDDGDDADETEDGDLKLPGSPSVQGAGGMALDHDRRVNADLTADSLSTVPLMPPLYTGRNNISLGN
ncbi:hypothetical protein PoB_000423700 [Plakobranchus ocellatus]|uniref:Uncharacterized protein n=1 Tax=Plakobranchus ocellatus TaxID=259542 RepID=A0AAV3Y4S7_9GAST|nr:hypothetical protein PoB_000423700 [Plakobranchus ocellatus]